MPSNFIKGFENAVTQGVVVKRGGNFERNIAAATIDKSAKYKNKDIIVLKINDKMMNMEENGNEQINNIMASGQVQLEVNEEIFTVIPQQRETNENTNKTEIRFQKVL